MNESPFDLTPFWCLVSHDQLGRRMYASQYGLSHRPKDAHRFATQVEAEGALAEANALAEKYVTDRMRRDAEERRRKRDKDEDLPFSATLPLVVFWEDDLMAIYHDGSGLAREEWARGMRWLEKQTEALRLLRAFAEKWKETLAGASWSLDEWTCATKGPTVRLGACSYRGRHVAAEEIAGLFPGDWRRRKVEYPETGWLDYDWLAPLDGVTLLIERAERVRLVPVDPGASGTRVRIRRAVQKVNAEGAEAETQRSESGVEV